MSQNLPHIASLRRMTEALRTAFGHGFSVSGQLPITLGNASKVEPNVLVLRGNVEDYDDRFPDPTRGIVVLVEVSDGSLVRDAGTKAALYARHVVPECWIVDVPGRSVEVRREPRARGCAESRTYAEGELIPAGGGTVAVTDVLPKG